MNLPYYFSGTSCFNPFKDNELNGYSDMLDKLCLVDTLLAWTQTNSEQILSLTLTLLRTPGLMPCQQCR
jgi:hypothetical protein